MIDGTFLDKLDEIARYVRDRNEPFGGIQLIICGTLHSLSASRPIPDLSD
jgi:ATP-dependent DNA helicase PIF1